MTSSGVQRGLRKSIKPPLTIPCGSYCEISNMAKTSKKKTGAGRPPDKRSKEEKRLAHKEKYHSRKIVEQLTVDQCLQRANILVVLPNSRSYFQVFKSPGIPMPKPPPIPVSEPAKKRSRRGQKPAEEKPDKKPPHPAVGCSYAGEVPGFSYEAPSDSDDEEENEKMADAEGAKRAPKMLYTKNPYEDVEHFSEGSVHRQYDFCELHDLHNRDYKPFLDLESHEIEHHQTAQWCLMHKCDVLLDAWIEKAQLQPLVMHVEERKADPENDISAEEEHFKLGSANYVVGMNIFKIIQNLDADDGHWAHVSFVRLDSLVKFFFEKGRYAYELLASTFGLILTGMDEGLFKQDYLTNVVDESNHQPFPRPYWECFAESLAILGSVHGVKIYPPPSLDCVFRDERFILNNLHFDYSFPWALVTLQGRVYYEVPISEENGVKHFAPVDLPEGTPPPGVKRGRITANMEWRELFGGFVSAIMRMGLAGNCQNTKIAKKTYLVEHGIVLKSMNTHNGSAIWILKLDRLDPNKCIVTDLFGKVVSSLPLEFSRRKDLPATLQLQPYIKEANEVYKYFFYGNRSGALERFWVQPTRYTQDGVFNLTEHDSELAKDFFKIPFVPKKLKDSLEESKTATLFPQNAVFRFDMVKTKAVIGDGCKKERWFCQKITFAQNADLLLTDSRRDAFIDSWFLCYKMAKLTVAYLQANWKDWKN